MAKRRPKGDGMVRKRKDGRWESRIVIGHKADGTPIHKSAVAKTQKELLQKIKVIKEQYDGVDLSEECHITLREWFNKWLDEYGAPTLRKSTLMGYKQMAERMCEYL